MKKLNWAAQQRQNYIGERLRNVGTLNRFDIEKEFGVSIQQASADIATFIAQNPKAVEYDKSLKVYIYQGEDKPSLEDEIEKLYWEFDSEKKKGDLSERDVFKKKMRRLIHLCTISKGQNT